MRRRVLRTRGVEDPDVSREVLLTDGAARDLDEGYAAAYARGGSVGATAFLDGIQVVLTALGDGGVDDEPLPELGQLGMVDERQVVTDGGLKVVYRITGERVIVVLIAPVKRSFQALLERRLLDA